MSSVTLIIPCHNEEKRLNLKKIERFLPAYKNKVRFFFVNDGSTDQTAVLLRKLAESNPEQVAFLDLPRNMGKAEAVRQGILHVLPENPELVGYWDADLATPLKEIPRFLHRFQKRKDLQFLCGCRLCHLGAQINRKLSRHLIGRAFATAASIFLKLPVYDTQCGAKMFRADIAEKLFEKPFQTRWLFDLEVLARFLTTYGHTSALRQIEEIPLRKWCDVSGSSLSIWSAPRILLDFARIWPLRRHFLED